MGLVVAARAVHHQGIELDLTDELIDALVDPGDDDTLIALRAALLRQLEPPNPTPLDLPPLSLRILDGM